MLKKIFVTTAGRWLVCGHVAVLIALIGHDKQRVENCQYFNFLLPSTIFSIFFLPVE